MLTEIIRAFAFIFVAEMGDKTQILAMAFATKYDIKKVLLGIFIGSLLNHGLAVLFGNSLSLFIPTNTLQILAGFAFVSFALWSLKMNNDHEEDKKKMKYGPVMTVAIAFFIGELGDKTQLTAIALAANTEYPLFILIGTVSGMLVTGAFGIYIGIKLGNKIPEFFIKIGASTIFFFFGFLKLFQSVPSDLLRLNYVIPFMLITFIFAYLILKPSLVLRREGKISLYRNTAEQLRSFYHEITRKLEDICLGENVCGTCEGTNCLVGYTKSIIDNAKKGRNIDFNYIENLDNQKRFDRDKVFESLKLTIYFLKNHPKNKRCKLIHQARMNFETILFGTYIKEYIDYEEYKKNLENIDKNSIKNMRLL